MRQYKVLEKNTQNSSPIDIPNNYRKVTFISLFASSGTILCCALPALLVAIGAGASLSSFLGVFPQIIWISQFKEYIFIFAFALIIVAGVFQWNARKLPCPINKEIAYQCLRARKISMRIYIFSVTLLSVGFIFTFILPIFMAV